MIFVDESHQTVPQIGGMYEGDRSRKQTLVDYGFRLPVGARQPTAALRRVPRRRCRRWCSSRRRRARGSCASRTRRRAADPADVPRRPRGRAAADEEPDRRPAQRDPPARGGRRARPRDDADQEDVRGPDRLPARGRRQGALPPLGDRHARAHPDHPRATPRRVRRARRRQPPARRARPARGLAGRDPRRRQGRASCAAAPRSCRRSVALRVTSTAAC